MQSWMSPFLGKKNIYYMCQLLVAVAIISNSWIEILLFEKMCKFPVLNRTTGDCNTKPLWLSRWLYSLMDIDIKFMKK